MNFDEKPYAEREKRFIDEIEKKHGKSVEQLREEREQRILDAMALKEPDKVPVTIHGGGFAANYAGIPLSSMYYDPTTYTEACLKVLIDFEPDSGGAAAGTNSGYMLELLDPRHQRWPGGNLPPDVAYQFVEGEYMTADEYDLFLSDPSDFIIRYYLPRLYGTFEPLTDLPSFRDLIGGLGFGGVIALLNNPRYKELGEKLSKAAEEQDKWMKTSADFGVKAERLGFPMQPMRGNTPGGWTARASATGPITWSMPSKCWSGRVCDAPLPASRAWLRCSSSPVCDAILAALSCLIWTSRVPAAWSGTSARWALTGSGT